MGKSTDVCIKEVRCFGFPDWGLVPTIGSDRDIANESAYDKQQYDAKRNGIPSGRFDDTLSCLMDLIPEHNFGL